MNTDLALFDVESDLGSSVDEPRSDLVVGVASRALAEVDLDSAREGRSGRRWVW